MAVNQFLIDFELRYAWGAVDQGDGPMTSQGIVPADAARPAEPPYLLRA
jgi:hypothetical protein